MFKFKNIAFYVITILAFAALIYFVLLNGKTLETGKSIVPHADVHASTFDQVKELFTHNITHPLAILLLQIITIIFFARTFGFIFSEGRIGIRGDPFGFIFPCCAGFFRP